MRKIKFRAWDNELKRMCRKVYVGSEGWHGEYWENEVMVLCFSDDNDAGNVLMQFTGLHDKNGKEIWEGDIIRNFIYKNIKTAKIPDIYVYKFNDEEFTDGSKYEVLGNIYENPELLK